jgi:hypothetical protein
MSVFDLNPSCPHHVFSIHLSDVVSTIWIGGRF